MTRGQGSTPGVRTWGRGQLCTAAAAASGTVDWKAASCRERPVNPFSGPFPLSTSLDLSRWKGRSARPWRTFRLGVRKCGRARAAVQLGARSGNAVRRAHSSGVDGCASAEPTLDELAQKLWELRQHLEQVLTGLGRATSHAATDFRAADASLRCHACHRTGSTRQTGWTLRLCGDDELHPFCPDCDRRHADGRNGAQAAVIPQGMHHRPVPGDVARDLPAEEENQSPASLLC